MSIGSEVSKRGGKYSLLFIAVTLAAAGVWVVLDRMQPDNPSAGFRTARVVRGDVENTITAVGTLQPSRYVDVGAQVSGQLRSLKVQVGDFTKGGQLLAEIDPRVYLARVDEAKATLENLRAQLKIKKAQLNLSTKQFARHQDLLKQDAFAQSEVEVSEASLESAKAEIEAINAQINQAEATLQTAKVNLEYTKITAPMEGTVVSIPAREGQTLNASQQTPVILRIADMDTMTVWTQVSEADVLRLGKDQEAYFTVLGSPERRWEGKLQQILPTPEIVNNVTFYNALFDVPNPEHALRVQMTAQVFFVLEKAQQVLLVPVSGLVSRGVEGGGKKAGAGAGRDNGETASGAKERGRRSVVRLLRPDGTVEERPVRVGVVSPLVAEIISGIEEGDVVVAGTETPT
jgi:membrane fusion protein, macrolide-specific efflux system